ncbi:MAG TPA: cation:dicarboxylase symporter family transporter [Terracidiphilus sp.]|nr:cation:dicarboxylase symporter family transporter [Terracidiphilus sp.]
MNPQSVSMRPAQAGRASAPRSAALAVAASVVVAAGLIAGFLHAPAGVALSLRCIGFVLFLPFAVRRRSLLVWTFFAMAAGAELGVDAPHIAANARFLGDLFLRLVRIIVAPLIFGGIVTGIAGHDELRSVGRVGLKALVLFEVVTTLGLLLGAIAINISHAGIGVALPAQAVVPAAAANAPPSEGWQSLVLNIFPENIAQAIAQNQVLQVAVFALLFGIALASLPAARRAPLVDVLQSLTETMFRMTRIVMYMAPLAAGGALAYTVGSMGVATLLPLMKLVVTYYAALAAFILLGLVPILLLARVPLRRFLAAIAEPAAIGFATTTSEAALPLAMENMEEFGVPRWIVSFVIPTGYSFNMTGSSLYLSMAALFAAQAAGMHLSIGEQMFLLATLTLTSKGVAGVPRAVLVILLGTASSFHIPTAAILLLLGVDTLIDMGRASMNVVGNCIAAAAVAQWEGELKPAAVSE